jgi:hypothetical protein
MNFLITHGTTIIMCNGRIIHDEAIAVENKFIAEVGRTHELQESMEEIVEELAEMAK